MHVVESQPGRVALSVYSQGSIVPRVQSKLVPEVSGRVNWVSPALADGGAYQLGHPLHCQDTVRYESHASFKCLKIRFQLRMGFAR